jgi:hypothetical protein
MGLVLGLAIAAVLAGTVQAAPPWAALFPFQRVEADPQKVYALTEQHGPWMILCATFGSETAKAEAQALCLELRRDFQLEAFVYAQNYDYDKRERGLGYDHNSTAGELKPKMMKYLRDGKFQEWAVMVGHFTSVEDPALAASLTTIKQAWPKCMETRAPSGGKMKDDPRKSVDIRDVRQWILSATLNSTSAPKKIGPLATAFAIPNPLRPKEDVAPPIDPLVLEMNQAPEVTHSLFKCPGKYTVRVATFRGRVTIDQREIRKVEHGGELDSTLDVAELKAHQMAEELRSQGVEAYEFHDRVESIVTVGSFDSIGTPRDDGKIELSPAVRAVMDRYGATTANVLDSKQQAVSALKPRTTSKRIPFDVQPWPVNVPKIPAATAFGGVGFFR